MIKFVRNDTDTEVRIEVDPQKSVYLDHWAIRHFSEPKNEIHRAVFLDFLNSGGTLLISYANVIDLLGNAPGESREQIRKFLQNIGPRWAPIKIWPQEVIERESRFKPGMSKPCHDDTFLSSLIKEFDGQMEKAINLSSVIEALERDAEGAKNLRQHFRDKASDLLKFIVNAKNQGASIAYIKGERTTRNAFNGLVSMLLVDSKKLDTNDITDILHASVPSVYAKYLLLDAHWATKVKQSLDFDGLMVFDKKNIERFIAELEAVNATR